MKDKVIIILLAVSVLLLIILVFFGFKIGRFEIPSISGIIHKNGEINSQIDNVSQLSSITHPQEVATLESTITDLKTQKEKFEQLSGFEEGEKPWYETEEYDISYLWKQLGRLATKQKVKLAIDVKKTKGEDLYNLYFTIEGDYVTVSSYIKKIEDDETLTFRIYNFKLVPGSSDIQLKCTFAVKDVRINKETLIQETLKNDDADNNNNNENNNNNNNNNNDNNNNNNDNNNNNNNQNTNEQPNEENNTQNTTEDNNNNNNV